MTYHHKHVSELPDSPVVECTWATGVELARAALYGTTREPPATGVEREALRVAGGGSNEGGSTYMQMAAGCQRRYGWSPSVTESLVAAPGRGYFLGVQGEYAALPDHYRRWDPGFAAGHSAVVYNIDGPLMWCDPLVPPTVDGWVGEPISWPTVTAYFRALPGAHIATAKLAVPPPAWHMTIASGTRDIEYARMSPTGCVAEWLHYPWSGHASGAPIATPVDRKTCSTGSVNRLAVVKTGKLAGKLVRETSQVVFHQA